MINHIYPDGYGTNIISEEYHAWNIFGPSPNYYVFRGGNDPGRLDNKDGDAPIGGSEMSLYNVYGKTTPAHELGHSIGYGHSDDGKSIMFPYDDGRLPYPSLLEMHRLIDAYKRAGQ